MNQITVKERLIGQITAIEDETFLKELEDIILNLKNDDQEVLILNDEIKESIAKSESDIENGRLISNDDAMRQIKEWLQRK